MLNKGVGPRSLRLVTPMTNERSNSTSIADRAVGAFLGAAIGDALGWPQELRNNRVGGPKRSVVQKAFQSWRRRSGGRYLAYEEVINPGEYSDDTQLLLAVARSLLTSANWSEVLHKFELPFWLTYERGGGSATKAAAQSWLAGKAPWLNPKCSKQYFGAGGNGVAVRIAPHVFLPRQSVPSLLQQVMLNGILTHGHPRALVGALLYAYALWIASHSEGSLKFGGLVERLRDESKIWGSLPTWDHGCSEWMGVADKAFVSGYRDCWDSVVQEARAGLGVISEGMNKGALAVEREVLGRLGCFDKGVNGAGTVSALVAIYLASRYAADPVTGLLEAAFAEGTDTDTNCSMVGGLIGAILGSEWILPEWKQVQDASYIATLAELLTHGTASESEVPQWNQRSVLELWKELLEGTKSEFTLGPLGRVVLVQAIEHNRIVKSARAVSWKLQTETGQTIYVSRVVRDRAMGKGGDTPSLFSDRRPEREAKDVFLNHSDSPDAGSAMGLVHLMKDLAGSLPPQMPVGYALDVVIQVIHQLQGERNICGVHALKSNLQSDEYVRQLLARSPMVGKTLGVQAYRSLATRLVTYLN